MKKIAYGMMALLGAVCASCDAHRDFPDEDMKIGQVVCTDGSVMSSERASELGKKPVAVVFHVSRDPEFEGKGLAVYIKELSGCQFADTVGVVQGTSASVIELDGNLNTYAMLACGDMESPAALAVFDIWSQGQSAYLPSVAECRLLFGAKDAVNATMSKIGGKAVGVSADGDWTWTSTEVSGQATHKAWLYSLASGTMQETPKDQWHKVRPIITISE